jgi:hypothetical protein
VCGRLFVEEALFLPDLKCYQSLLLTSTTMWFVSAKESSGPAHQGHKLG